MNEASRGRRPARRRMRWAVAAAGAVVAACSGSGTPTGASTGPQAGPEPTPASAPRSTPEADPAPATAPTALPPVAPSAPPPPAPPPLAWSPCGLGECATLLAPLDPLDPRPGETVELAVGRRPARGLGERLGVLVVLPGGPGGSGLDLVAAGGGLGGIADRFDVVGFDARGVGASAAAARQRDGEGLYCGGALEAFYTLDPSPDDPAEQAALDGAATAAARACEEAAGALVGSLSTAATVADIETLRQALGVEQITLDGFSYGSYTALRYAQTHPEHARAVVVGGVVDPTVDLPSQLRAQAAAVDAAVAAGLGAVTPRYRALSAQLDRAPLTVGAQPVGQAELERAATMAAYSPGFASRVVEAVGSAEQGRGQPILDLAAAYSSSVNFAVYTATLCADWPRPTDHAGWAAAAAEGMAGAPLVGASVMNELAPCAAWRLAPPNRPPALDAARADAPPPMLVLANTGDPITPPAGAERAAALLPNAALLRYSTGGHVRHTRNPCALDIVNAFLTNRQLPAPDTAC